MTQTSRLKFIQRVLHKVVSIVYLEGWRLLDNDTICHLRHASALPRSLRQLAHRSVVVISIVDRQVVFRLAQGILDARPFLDRFPEFPKPGPDRLIVASFAFLRHTETLFEVIEDPEPHLKECQSHSNAAEANKVDLQPLNQMGKMVSTCLKHPIVLTYTEQRRNRSSSAPYQRRMDRPYPSLE